MASCSKNFRRLFNKKVFTDTAVIDALIAVHSVHARLICVELIHQHIQPRMDLAIVRLVNHAGDTAVHMIIYPAVIGMYTAQTAELIAGEPEKCPRYSNT